MSFFAELEKTMLPVPGDAINPDAPPPQQEEQSDAVDEAFDNLVEEEQERTNQIEVEAQALSAVEVRLSKAMLYRAVLENPLFPDDQSAAASEVEQEYRKFTLERLNELMGVQSEEKKASSLSDEEIKVLKLWSRKLLGNPSVVAVADKAPPQVQAPRPMPAPVQPVMRPVVTKPRSVQPAAVPKQNAQIGKVSKASVKAKPTTEVRHENGVIEKGNKRYIEVDGRDVFTNEPKKVRLDVTPPIKGSIKPAPMPSPQAMMMLEANNAANNIPKSGKLAEALNKVMK